MNRSSSLAGIWVFFLAATSAAIGGPDGGLADAGGAQSDGAPQQGFDPRWSHVSAPSPGPARAIGLPGAGCVQGAAPLSRRNPNYVVVHPERNRAYGHPDLIAYLRELAVGARKHKLGPLYIGDLGQPCGGPTPTGHRSHQNGLDVDVWYGPPSKPIAQGKPVTPPSVVDLRTHKMTPAWNGRAATLLQMAASQPSVDRIFVNPSVKRALCLDKKGRGPWLGRLRPWWGHQDHFHVRLRCPANSPDCTSQPSLGAGDGCDASLDWWFSADAQKAAAKRGPPGEGAPALPEQCAELLGHSHLSQTHP